MQPLTIDSPELNGTYTGFSEGKIRFIKETIVLLQHFTFFPDVGGSLTINGAAFDKPDYAYFLNKAKGGLHAQVAKEGRVLFGVHLWKKEDGSLESVAYHANGPASSYDSAELDDFY